jgi:hypothetical protein
MVTANASSTRLLWGAKESQSYCMGCGKSHVIDIDMIIEMFPTEADIRVFEILSESAEVISSLVELTFTFEVVPR